MIDKNFYLENLSAFDILIQDEDRKQAEAVIFRVYSMLQRDKIWLQNVATEDEIFEEDADLLAEVEAELKELDEKYDFRFDDFYKLVQQEMKKLQSNSQIKLTEDDFEDENFENEEDFLDDEEQENLDETNHDLQVQDEEDDDLEDDYDTENSDAFSHLSDEEIDLVPEYILASAKTRFNYPEFLQTFPYADESFLEEEFLFPVIASIAFAETDAEIAEKIFSSFRTLCYPIKQNDLLTLIAQKGKELGLEILAFKIASDSLNEGAHPIAVVQQISQLLKV